MNRLSTLILIGLAGLLASCGSSIHSSTEPGLNDVYSMVVSPTQFTLNAGDWSSITATVDLSYLNGAPKPIAPQPTIKFYSSDVRVTVSPAGRGLRRTMGHNVPGLHANEHASHRIRDHHGLRCQ